MDRHVAVATLELLSATHVLLQRAWFKQPPQGWPDPIRIPRPGEPAKTQGDGQPVDPLDKMALLRVVMRGRVQTTPRTTDGPRHVIRMRPADAPDGPYVPDGEAEVAP